MKTFFEEDNLVNHTTDAGMKHIPAGTFPMGADGWGEFEGPVHEVYTDAFLMDETSVTNAAFARFAEATGYKTTAEIRGVANGYQKGEMKEIPGLSWRSYATQDRQDHPVVLVSWEDANAFAKWAGKRLPTEAEWEKAARGGLNQCLYPWGNTAPQKETCNWGRTTIDYPATTDVRQFMPNSFGLYDMAGNVWNWCQDWFGEDYYSNGSNQNPQGTNAGITKVRRGASFNIMQTFRLRCSNRGAYRPETYAINIGFRCVKNISYD